MNALADNCPECMTPDSAVTVAPHSARPEGSAVTAEYACPNCGHCWHTSRLLTAEELGDYEAGAA